MMTTIDHDILFDDVELIKSLHSTAQSGDVSLSYNDCTNNYNDCTDNVVTLKADERLTF